MYRSRFAIDKCLGTLYDSEKYGIKNYITRRFIWSGTSCVTAAVIWRATDVKSESVQFETVPLRLQVGAREFLDNDQLEVPDLLQAMAAEKSASSTACPSPAAFARAFEKGDRTICFTISANLSGTYNAAVMGRELTLESIRTSKSA